MAIPHLALAVGASFAAGLNLYLTVLSLGLLQRFNYLELPAPLRMLQHEWVLATVGLLFLIEFLADKIPYLDNTWDAVHTFLRIPAGAVLAAAALADLPAYLVWIAALVGGFVTFTAHGAKASTRLALNTSPEPFSNWLASLAEDLLSVGLLWLVSTHPYLAFGVVAGLLLLAGILIFTLFRFFRAVLKKLLPKRRSAAGA